MRDHDDGVLSDTRSRTGRNARGRAGWSVSGGRDMLTLRVIAVPPKGSIFRRSNSRPKTDDTTFAVTGTEIFDAAGGPYYE
jgi:hypothetical protein